MTVTALILLMINLSTAQLTQRAYVNGKIYTVNPLQPQAEVVVTQGNTIIYVGSRETAGALLEESRIIDLQGKLMLPGFIDNHTHFIGGGFYLLGIDLRPAKSTADFKRILKNYVKTRPGEWITGGNWDHEQWETKDLPSKEMIDDYSADTPILVSRFDGHMSLANSYALKLAGITRDTPSPSGGLIVKDKKTGEPTGVLKDEAAYLVSRLIPDSTPEQIEQAARRALQEAKENGITSLHDITYQSHLEIYQKLEREGDLTCRIYTRLPISEYKDLVDSGIRAGFGSDRLKVGALKGFADGSLGSSTALFFEPYTQDPTTSGLAMGIVTDGRLKKWALDADKNKLQMSIHAIGDKANAQILDMFAEIIDQNPVWDRRFRMEHAQHIRFEDIPRFAQLGVIASVQPYHAIDDGVWAEKRIGDRIRYTYPFRSFLDAGVKLCFGSDWDVAPLNVLWGIYAAVTRRTLDGKNPDGWIPEQKITVEEAIRCYTINNAYAAFEENTKGSIEVGKIADFVVLNQDILTIDPVKIFDTKAIMTVLNGEIIYQGK
ncbi:MAG: amidohydrolase [Calditrichales bacterium]|nr:MAG: amidohydrolase [Calditrichales bacterium]